MAAIKALQQWCKQQCEGYRDVNITNMTTSFRDGLAFCAILHKHRPDLINFNSLSKENVYENNHLAFRVAEEKLGIPALLDAEDMVQLKVPDRLSILTYVSQYYNYFHGRSPIGGMGAVKRPPPDTIEEPIGKKVTNDVPPSTNRPQPAPRSNPPALKDNLVVENAPVRAGIREIDSNGSVSSSCTLCGKHVHLVQRHLSDGKLYHRNCFKCKQCSRTLQPGNYKIGDDPGTFICSSHHPTITSPVTANSSPSGPYRPAASAFTNNQKSPSVTSSLVPKENDKTPVNKFVPNTTNSVNHEPTNRTAVGFVSNNKNSSNIGMKAGQGPASKVTPSFQKATNKESSSAANTVTPEPTNRTEVGFFNVHKWSPNVSNASESENTNKASTGYSSKNVINDTGPRVHEQANSPTPSYLQTYKGKTDNANSSLSGSSKEAKKEPWQTKTSSSTSNSISVLSSPGGKWSSSPVSKHEPQDSDSSTKKFSSTAAKNKEARDKFFQASPVVIEPTNSSSSSAKDTPKVSSSNGPGRSLAIGSTSGTSEVNMDKDRDKARSYLLKALPGSSSPKPGGAEKSSSVSIPQRNLDVKQTESKTASRKEEPQRPVPKERQTKAATSSPEPPKTTPMYTFSKETSAPNAGKSLVSTQTGLSGAGSVPNAQVPSSKVSKSEAPEDWRSLLKSVEKRPSIPGAILEKPPLQDQEKTSSRVPEKTSSRVPEKTSSRVPEKTSSRSHDATWQTKPTSVTTTVMVNINPNPSGKENKPVQFVVSPASPTQEGKLDEKARPTATPPKKKLLKVNVDLISDLPKTEQKWQDASEEPKHPSWRFHLNKEDNVSSKNTENFVPSSTVKISKLLSQDLSENGRAPYKSHSEYIPEDEIQQRLQKIEQELDVLELRGVHMEKELRSSDGDDSEDALMVDWFKLIHKKQLLLREESELNYISRTQMLRKQQHEVETELRNLMNKPDHQKTTKDAQLEQELLDKLLLLVNDRNEIVQCLDEDRIREKEEDEVIEAMIQRHSDTHQKEESPDPSTKRRSRFSFSGLFKPKDKSNA
ncbi:MICAL-like protein 2 [Spea bombifrons]|uniref:MICAL-like protein 2 n=1 Tax=Spea bombifrons TaxID=233779 RepID=UPI00234B2E99|nr:MICAL-like protein 2 [Spea bombifrons]